jgi:hypothetical protein
MRGKGPVSEASLAARNAPPGLQLLPQRHPQSRGSARAAETHASLSAGRSACLERCMVLSSRCRVVRRIRKTRRVFMTPYL